jgi:hypothetical protein
VTHKLQRQMVTSTRFRMGLLPDDFALILRFDLFEPRCLHTYTERTPAPRSFVDTGPECVCCGASRTPRRVCGWARGLVSPCASKRSRCRFAADCASSSWRSFSFMLPARAAGHCSRLETIERLRSWMTAKRMERFR